MDPSISRFLVEAAVIWCQNRQMEVTIPFLPCRSKIVNISSVTAVEGLGGIQQRTHNTLARSLPSFLPAPRVVDRRGSREGEGGERRERERESDGDSVIPQTPCLLARSHRTMHALHIHTLYQSEPPPSPLSSSSSLSCSL